MKYVEPFIKNVLVLLYMTLQKASIPPPGQTIVRDRALGVMLTHRSHDTTLTLAYGPVERGMDQDTQEVGEFAPELLDNRNLVAAESMMRKLENDRRETR